MSSSRPQRPWLLPASLSLNVFLCTALIAHLLSDRGHRPPPPPPPTAMLEQMTRGLSGEDARILRESLASGIAEIERTHRAEADLPRHLQAILSREPFDKKAFKDVLVQSQHAREVLNDTLPDAIEKLSPDGRRRLATWHPEPPRPGMEPPHPGMEPPPGPPPNR